MTKRQDLYLQRRSRSEQSDQRQPNQAKNISHQPRASPNSTPLTSRIEFPTMTAIELDDNPAAVRDDAIQRLRVFAAHENPAAMRCDDVRNARAVNLVGRRIGDLDFNKEIPFGHGLAPVSACSRSRG